MIPLIEIAKDAQERERALARTEAKQQAERSEREARRRAALERLLSGFDYEISFTREGAADVALKHPTEPGRWLAFVAHAFSSDDEPLWPADGHEIRIRAGRIARWEVNLALAANQYIKEQSKGEKAK